MAQVDVYAGFNVYTAQFIETNILNPIVDFVTRKGCNITIDDLRNLLKISKVTVTTPSMAPYDAAVSQPTTQTRTTTTPKPRASKVGESGVIETCEHTIKKSPQRSGEKCGKRAFRWKRCKACLAKTCVKEELVKLNIATLAEIEEVLRDSKKKDGAPVAVINPAAPQLSKPTAAVLTSDQFISIDGSPGFYLHRESNLIVEKLPDGKYEVKGVNENNNARLTNPSDYDVIRKYGFLVNGAELPPVPAVAPIPTSPMPIYIPTSDQVVTVHQPQQIQVPSQLSLAPIPQPIQIPIQHSFAPVPVPQPIQISQHVPVQIPIM
jgi:hypothetical protein